MAAGHAFYVEPPVILPGNFKAQQIVIRIRPTRQYNPAPRQRVFMDTGLLLPGCFFYPVQSSHHL
jgi:hypothetical protein